MNHKELVEHTDEMVNWCKWIIHSMSKEKKMVGPLFNFYEGKLDAYTSVLARLTDIERVTA